MESLFQARDGFVCGVEEAPHLSLAHARRDLNGCDNAGQRFQVVDDDDGVSQYEHRIGSRRRARRRVRQTLDRPHDVVREVADGATPEGAKFRDERWPNTPHNCLQIGDGVRDQARAVPANVRQPAFDGGIGGAPRLARLRSQKGVSRPGLAPCRGGLEQESKGWATDLGERGDGRVGIKEDVAPNRDERRVSRELKKSFKRHDVALVA